MLCCRHCGDSSSVGGVDLAIIYGGCAVGSATHLLCSASNYIDRSLFESSASSV